MINDHESQACLVEDGKLRFLPLVEGHHWGMRDRNFADNGDIVGQSTLGTGTQHSIFYHDGKPFDMNLPGTASFAAAQGLNGMGQVVGRDHSNEMPFIWEKGKLTYLKTPKSEGTAYAINDSGEVPGVSFVRDDDPELHAARWIDGSFEDLNPPWAERKPGKRDKLGGRGRRVGNFADKSGPARFVARWQSNRSWRSRVRSGRSLGR